MRWAARVCWLIVLGGILCFALGSLLEPQLYPIAADVNGGCSGGGMGDPCILLLGFVGFVCLIVPALLAMLIAWILGLILAVRSRQWVWLASMLIPLVVAVPLFVIGSPLAANAYGYDPAKSDLGNEMLNIGWIMVGLSFLGNLVYSLWPRPKQLAAAPTANTLQGPTVQPTGPQPPQPA